MSDPLTILTDRPTSHADWGHLVSPRESRLYNPHDLPFHRIPDLHQRFLAGLLGVARTLSASFMLGGQLLLLRVVGLPISLADPVLDTCRFRDRNRH